MIITILSDVVPSSASMAPSYENFAESEPPESYKLSSKISSWQAE